MVSTKNNILKHKNKQEDIKNANDKIFFADKAKNHALIKIF